MFKNTLPKRKSNLSNVIQSKGNSRAKRSDTQNDLRRLRLFEDAAYPKRKFGDTEDVCSNKRRDRADRGRHDSDGAVEAGDSEFGHVGGESREGAADGDQRACSNGCNNDNGNDGNDNKNLDKNLNNASSREIDAAIGHRSSSTMEGAYFSNGNPDDSTIVASDSESESSQTQLTDDIPALFLDRLMSFSLFHDAPKVFYVAIARKLKLVVYHAHEFIVKAGEPARAMYWILRGSVNVTSPDGEIIHAELLEGSYFGEIGILFNRPRTATVISRNKVLLGVLTAETFNQVLLHFPSIERQIRDEAQERLAMQEKQRKAGVTKIIHDEDIIRRNGSPSLVMNDPTTPVHSHNSSLALDPTPLNFSSNSPYQLYSTEEMLYPPQLPKRESLASANLSAMPHAAYMNTIDDSISTRQFLKSLPLFTTLPTDIIHGLALCVEVKQIPPFEYVFRAGDYGKDIYFIVSGEVEVLGPSTAETFPENVNLPSFKSIDVVLARLSQGQYFGEMGFLNSITNENDQSSKSTRSADIRSVSNCTLLVLTGETLREFCDKYPLIEQEIKRTAEERNKKNSDLQLVDEIETQDKNFPLNSTDLVAPVSRKGYVDIEILGTDGERNPQANGSIEIPSLPFSSQNQTSINDTFFNPNFNFSKSPIASTVNRDTTTSSSNSLKLSNDSSLTPVSATSQINSTTPPPLSEKQSINGNSNNRTMQIANLDQIKPLELHVPPLNPPIKHRNSAFYVPNPSPIQYMSHLKRVRLSNIGGGLSRRRSSVLSVGPLPDRILLQCFQYLPLPELMKLRLVCRRWRQLLYVAPELFDSLDLTPWNKHITDKALQEITNFVGSRPKRINISNCFHVTDEGFSYMINEIGIGGQIVSLKMASCWDISAMPIMDIAVPSIGKILEEIDISNCRKVRDDVIQRLIGWDYEQQNTRNNHVSEGVGVGALYQIDEPIPGMEGFGVSRDRQSSLHHSIGCSNLKKMLLRHCKNLTDLTLYHISLYGKDRMAYLDFTRCTGLTDVGFSYWSFQSFPNLEVLILSECIFLTDSTIRSVVNSCPNLAHLNLSFCCSLTDASIELLCVGCQKLEYLDISFCGRAVSDVSLLNISMHLRNLKHISLKGCLRVTRSGVDSLLGGYAPLKLIDISQCKNAHMYQGGIPATRFETVTGSKSVFLTMEDSSRYVEVVM